MRGKNMNRLFRGVAAAGILATAGFATSAHAVANDPGSVAQQAQVSALAAKVIAAIQAMPATSSEGAYEGAIVDATAGADPVVALAALRQVQGTPGLPAKATASIARAIRSYADNSATGATGAVGPNALGATPGSNSGTPGFAGGGGGGTTSTYTAQ